MSWPSMQNRDLKGKRLLMRVDFNVPLSETGAILSEARLKLGLESLQLALDAGAKVCLVSHLGRPKEMFEAATTLAPIAKWLADHLRVPVHFASGSLESAPPLKANTVVLLENARFIPGEYRRDAQLGARYAALCDLFVMDAFAVAHRDESSVTAVAAAAKEVCLGLLMERELQAVERLTQDERARPKLAILGGSKLSTKCPLIQNLMGPIDHFVLGGGILNTFLAAQGYPVGRSMIEPAWLEEARRLMSHIKIQPLIDLQVEDEEGHCHLRKIDQVRASETILDLGPETTQASLEILKEVRTVVWNGPLGLFEKTPFEASTRSWVEAIARSDVWSLAGGGETLEAIERFGGSNSFSALSTGGGAFLTALSGKTLPILQVLADRKKQDGKLEDQKA